tara:strand:- start:343 stop:1029 length:687 start_codon:yes stop_codon:yes gene_type:complete
MKKFVEPNFFSNLSSEVSHELQRQQLVRKQETEAYKNKVISHYKRLQLDQYEQLEDITRELNRLEQEQERMKQQIMDQPVIHNVGDSSMNFNLSCNNCNNGQNIRFSNNSKNTCLTTSNNQSFSTDSFLFASYAGNRQKEENLSSSSSSTFQNGEFYSYLELFGCSEDNANNNDGNTTINNNESSRPIFLRPSASASASASVSTIPHRNYISKTGSGDKIADAWFHRR